MQACVASHARSNNLRRQIEVKFVNIPVQITQHFHRNRLVDF